MDDGSGGPSLTIAVEGCLHGELDRVYDTLAYIERVQGLRIDVLLCCGDFQAVRNPADLESLACPPKYRALNSFYKVRRSPLVLDHALAAFRRRPTPAGTCTARLTDTSSAALLSIPLATRTPLPPPIGSTTRVSVWRPF